MRKKISIGIDIDRPQRSDATMKSAVVARNRRTCPKRCVSQPVSGTEIAFATANEVITHVPWSGDTPRSPAMAGIDTLAIDVSSTFMNVASDSATVPSASVAPDSGSGSWEADAAVFGVRTDPGSVAEMSWLIGNRAGDYGFDAATCRAAAAAALARATGAVPTDAARALAESRSFAA